MDGTRPGVMKSGPGAIVRQSLRAIASSAALALYGVDTEGIPSQVATYGVEDAYTVLAGWVIATGSRVLRAAIAAQGLTAATVIAAILCESSALAAPGHVAASGVGVTHTVLTTLERTARRLMLGAARPFVFVYAGTLSGALVFSQ